MRLAPLVLAAALVPAAPAGAETLTVTTPSRVFSPPQLQVVVGDTVRWSNTGNESHDVQALDGSFASAAFGPGAEFSASFDGTGPRPYVCVLHRSQMTGQLDVVPVRLDGPAAPLARGEAVRLTGRAPAGTAAVTIERATAGGPFAAVARLAPAADGTFAHSEPAQAGAYRAVAPGGASPEVGVKVVDRVRVDLRVTLGRHHTTLRIATDPVRPGARAVLQLYSPERFAWRRVTAGTLDARGRMTLTVARSVRRRARVVVLGDDGRPLATSRMVATWRERRRAGSAPRRRSPSPQHHGGHG